MGLSRKKLEILLNRLEFKKNPVIELEQYPTPSSVAATLLWHAYMRGDIEEKVVLDAGCGNGILGIGAALLGAKKVIFLDVDPGMILVAKKNAKKMSLSGEFVIADISEYNPVTPPDTVLMNPPFGRKSGGGDIPFLEKIFHWQKTTYMIHRLARGVIGYIRALAQKHGMEMEVFGTEHFEIPWLYRFHRKKRVVIEVFLARIFKASLDIL